MNDEYKDLDLGIEEDEEILAVPKKPQKKTTSRTTLFEPQEMEIMPEIDPEMDRENWPTIHIEMEDGKPNYEFVSASGTMKNGKPFGHDLQIMRGVDVQVPPSIVHVLRDAIATHHVPRRDPSNGKLKMERQDRSAVPWRLIKSGKYV